MENNNEIFTLDRGKVTNDIINTDNLKKILVDPHNNARVRDAVKNELKDLQSNINGLAENKQNEYLTRANDIFTKYSDKEKISSSKLIEEISKISSPKLQEIVKKVETKKIKQNNKVAANEESGWMEKFASGLIPGTLKRNQQTYAMLEEN